MTDMIGTLVAFYLRSHAAENAMDLMRDLTMVSRDLKVNHTKELEQSRSGSHGAMAVFLPPLELHTPFKSA